jgi:hypothetical protein
LVEILGLKSPPVYRIGRPSWGRRLHILLRQDGIAINRKKTQRLLT